MVSTPIFVIDLSSDCKTEETVLNLLTKLGLSLFYSGTKYLMCIITTSVCTLTYHIKPGDFYRIAANKYNAHKKRIEMAVARALETVTTDKIVEFNRALGCEMLKPDGFCGGTLISAICSRLIMLKNHASGKTYFA